MSNHEITALQQQIGELKNKLAALQKQSAGEEIPDYTFKTLDGEVHLRDLFGEHDTLLVIHNMGQGCRYCTLWADGFNGLLPHLESAMSVVLVSKDSPEVQRRFANSRGWRFRLASHGGGDYIEQQSVMAGGGNMPGAVVYERKGENVFRKNASVFGPGDNYCVMWDLLNMAGLNGDSWTPQFNYWQRPKKMDDGGENLVE
ncbi:DUF899 domain-containing protein [Microbulbifer sp. SH-1]|uniref:DUF899 family protein n=1 Tax=Microbulbifer sp. SH-1 TaxID=2681547 RepID=UPI00140C5A5D|nr:DUF899 family protein [Microbulbifer sp. SH-1]QIL91384.1 DUF899 domain-containing protein [Microbulbifer sp. SH-1]